MPEPGADERDERRRDAQSVLDGRPTSAAAVRSRRSLTLRVALFAAAMALVVVVGGVAAATAGVDSQAWRPLQRGMGHAVGAALLGVGLVVEGVGLFLMARSWRDRAVWRSPLVNLASDDRRRLLRQVRRGESVPSEDLGLATHLATSLTRQRPLFLAMGGVLLISLGIVAAGDSTRLGALLLVVGVGALVVGIVLGERDLRRARAWLARYGEDAAE